MSSAPTDSVRDTVLGALAAITRGDIEGFTSALHPEVVVHEPDYLPYGGDFTGKAGFLELFDQATKVIDFPTLEIVSATADETRCVLLMTCKLTTNREQRHITEHWVVQDGLIKDVRVFWFGLPE